MATIIGNINKALAKKSHHILYIFWVLGNIYIRMAIGAKMSNTIIRICRITSTKKATKTAKAAVATKLSEAKMPNANSPPQA